MLQKRNVVWLECNNNQGTLNKIIIGIAAFLLIAVFSFFASSIQTQSKVITENRLSIMRLDTQYANIEKLLTQILDNQAKNSNINERTGVTLRNSNRD